MASIGPTALYTGHVWARNGLSHPELATVRGRALHTLTSTALAPVRLAGGPSIDRFLLARHRAIDARLDAAIAAGRVGQVLEIAAGMSPRGWRFTERHPELVYVEADLPGMAARKRDALERIGRPPGHRVVELDAVAPAGQLSLGEVWEGELDPALGTAVITEGLLNYLGRDEVEGLWARIASRCTLYLADLFVRCDSPRMLGTAFSGALAAFVRGGVHLHFADAREARAGLRRAGFGEVDVARADLTRVVAARP